MNNRWISFVGRKETYSFGQVKRNNFYVFLRNVWRNFTFQKFEINQRPNSVSSEQYANTQQCCFHKILVLIRLKLGNYPKKNKFFEKNFRNLGNFKIRVLNMRFERTENGNVKSSDCLNKKNSTNFVLY